MAVGERSITAVLQDIVGNIQEIMRSEVRLAKTEIRDELVKAKGAAIFLSVGAVAGVAAAVFLLWTIVFALALVLPMWASSLIVTGVLALVAGGTLMVGVRHLKKVVPKPQRTIDSVKENLQWARHQVK